MTASVHEVLALARQHQVTIRVNGDKLKLSAPCKPPDELIAQIAAWKPRIIRALSERRYCAFRFVLDGCTTITAIRPGSCTLDKMQRHLGNQFGVGRITGLRGLQGVEPAYTACPSLRERS